MSEKERQISVVGYRHVFMRWLQENDFDKVLISRGEAYKGNARYFLVSSLEQLKGMRIDEVIYLPLSEGLKDIGQIREEILIRQQSNL